MTGDTITRGHAMNETKFAYEVTMTPGTQVYVTWRSGRVTTVDCSDLDDARRVANEALALRNVRTVRIAV